MDSLASGKSSVNFDHVIESCQHAYGWGDDEAFSILKEYRRFLELKIVLQEHKPPSRIIPSLPVAQMWYQHILDTAVYYEDCQQLCGNVIHHDPRSNASNKATLKRRMEDTVLAYQARFGEQPDKKIWRYDDIEEIQRAAVAPGYGSERSSHRQSGIESKQRNTSSFREEKPISASLRGGAPKRGTTTSSRSSSNRFNIDAFDVVVPDASSSEILRGRQSSRRTIDEGSRRVYSPERNNKKNPEERHDSTVSLDSTLAVQDKNPVVNREIEFKHQTVKFNLTFRKPDDSGVVMRTIAMKRNEAFGQKLDSFSDSLQKYGVRNPIHYFLMNQRIMAEDTPASLKCFNHDIRTIQAQQAVGDEAMSFTVRLNHDFIGNHVQKYRMKPWKPLEKCFRHFAETYDQPLSNLKFIHAEHEITIEDSPNDIGLQVDGIIWCRATKMD